MIRRWRCARVRARQNSNLRPPALEDRFRLWESSPYWPFSNSRRFSELCRCVETRGMRRFCRATKSACPEWQRRKVPIGGRAPNSHSRRIPCRSSSGRADSSFGSMASECPERAASNSSRSACNQSSRSCPCWAPRSRNNSYARHAIISVIGSRRGGCVSARRREGTPTLLGLSG